MNDEFLKKLADELHTTGAHLWEVLVSQARVEAWQDGILLLVYLGILVGLGFYARWVLKGEDEGHWFAIIPSAVIVVFVFIITIQSWVTEIVNPEFFALSKILTAVKK